EEELSLPQMEWAYVFQHEAAAPLLRELGGDEGKDLLSQWQSGPRGLQLKKEMSNRASHLLFDLAGRAARLWYVRRLWVDEENPEEEFWELTLATDAPTFPQILAEKNKTLWLKCKAHREGQARLKINDARFLKTDMGIKNLVSLPVLVRLAPNVPGY